MAGMFGKLIETASFGVIKAQVGQGNISDLQNPTAWLLDAVNANSRTVSGEIITANSVLMFPAYLAAIKNISEDIGKLSLKVFERLEGGGKTELTNDPLTPILGMRPNPNTRAMDFNQTMIHHALNGGNSYAEIVRNGRGKVAELHLIHSSRVRPFFRMDSNEMPQLRYEIKGDIQTITGKQFEAVELPAKDVLHIAGLGSDGLVGYSIYSMVAQSLSIGLAAETFSAAFYGNGTTLTGVLESAGELSDDAYKRLRKSWRRLHRGAKRANGLAILESGVKFSPISVDPEKSQLIEARRFQVEEAARILRIPQHKIGSMESATFSNIEEQNLEYVRDTLGPWMERIKQEYTFKFFGMNSNKFCQFEIDALTLGDSKTRTESYKALFNVGAMTPNQIRDSEGKNKSNDPGMDDYYLQGNLTTVGRISKGENTMVNERGSSALPQASLNTEVLKMSEEDKKTNALAKPVVEDVSLKDQVNAHSWANLPIFKASAERIVSKEHKALGKAIKRHKGDELGFKEWSHVFFNEQKADIVKSFDPACAVMCNTYRSETHPFFPLSYGFLPDFSHNYAVEGLKKAFESFKKGHDLADDLEKDGEKMARSVIKLICETAKGAENE